MNGIVKIALATIVATFSFVSLSAQTKCCDKETKLRWGVTAGFNGLNGNTLNLSDHRGRYGFNVGARMEYLFCTTPSRMYLDAELGLLKLGWKSSTNDGYYYSDYYKDEAGIQTENWKATMDAYYLHLPIIEVIPISRIQITVSPIKRYLLRFFSIYNIPRSRKLIYVVSPIIT